jgi:D-glutamate cyclase
MDSIPNDPATRPPAATGRSPDGTALDWDALERATHVDPAGRNLAALTADGGFWDTGHLAAAATDLAQHARRVVIVTGFCRWSSAGMTAETDGPPGALLLARALLALGIDVLLVSDRYGAALLDAGCDHLGLGRAITHEMPIEQHAADDALPASDRWCEAFFTGPALGATHLVAIERPGPSHTPVSLAMQQRSGPVPLERFEREVPPTETNRCHNMRGERIDRWVAKTDRLFAWIERHRAAITTIGIGDGGNEIGMGAIAWEILARALDSPQAGRIASRVACDHLLLAGVSDWGAYGLALATAMLRGAAGEAAAWDAPSQATLIRTLVDRAGAVDGVTGEHTATVDGLELDVYLAALVQMRKVLGLKP